MTRSPQRNNKIQLKIKNTDVKLVNSHEKERRLKEMKDAANIKDNSGYFFSYANKRF